jgi:hypothetical protein
LIAMRARGLSVAGALLAASLVASGTARADRPDTPNSDQLPPLYAPGEVVETFPSPGGQFLIHFSRSGPNQVPATDADGSGTPDFVEEVAATYDAVLAFYQGTLGYLPPVSDSIVPGDNGGDGRFDVYLLDFGNHGSDGSFRQECQSATSATCPGYMVQENDFVGYPYPSPDIGVRILASHEFFHAVQAAYRVGAGSVIAEATATWATEKFDSTLTDFESQITGFFDRPDHSLDQEPTTAVDAFPYGAAIFFQFLDERFDAAVIRQLWEAVAADATRTWAPLLDALLTSQYSSSFAAAFGDFAEWNLLTGTLADPARSYANGANYPTVAVTSVIPPYSKLLVRMFHASARYYTLAPSGRTQVAAQLVAPGGDPAVLGAVKLRLYTRKGSVLSSVTESTGPTQLVMVDASTADEVFAAIVNPEVAGDSRHPGFCFGSPDEVAACVAQLGTSPPADGGVDGSPGADAAGSDLGGGGDAVVPDAGATSDGPGGDSGSTSHAGGGCTLAAGPATSSLGGLLMLIPLLMSRRVACGRRRRRC